MVIIAGGSTSRSVRWPLLSPGVMIIVDEQPGRRWGRVGPPSWTGMEPRTRLGDGRGSWSTALVSTPGRDQHFMSRWGRWESCRTGHLLCQRRHALAQFRDPRHLPASLLRLVPRIPIPVLVLMRSWSLRAGCCSNSPLWPLLPGHRLQRAGSPVLGDPVNRIKTLTYVFKEFVRRRSRTYPVRAQIGIGFGHDQAFVGAGGHRLGHYRRDSPQRRVPRVWGTLVGAVILA